MNDLVEYPLERIEPPRPTFLSRVPAVCLAVSVGVLCALLAFPTTRWIVWRESGVNMRDSRSLSSTLYDLGVKDVVADPPYRDPNEATLAADHFGPDDFQLQLAAAVWRHYARINLRDPGARQLSPGQSAGDEIRKLKRKFGDNPSIYANAIRHDTYNRIRMNRPVDEQILIGSTNSAGFPAPVEATKQQLDQYLSDCEEGERLEPQNGYFPMLRAAGLYSAHRDREALAELHRASGLTEWQPHYVDEAEGAWRMGVLADGDGGALHQMATQASILYPELALLRQTARIAIANAIKAELAGKREDGLHIRMDVAHCGALMRSEAPCTVGNLVGIAITKTVVSRPGGAPILMSKTKRITPAQLTNTFTAYLGSIGANREAVWYLNELKAGASAQGAALSGINNSPASLGSIARLSLLWIGGMALFGNAFWLLVLGVVGSLYVRRWNARQAAGWVREDMFVLLMGGACIVMGASLIAWTQARTAAGMAQAGAALATISGGNAANIMFSDPGAVRVIGLCVLLTLPAFITVLAVIVASVRRRPVLLDIARAYRSAGLTLSALLIFGYAIVVTQTARREAEMHASLVGMEKHEARFVSNAVGASWPALQHD